MTYSPGRIEPLARELCADLPGFHLEVAREWIRAESGANGNVLGVTENHVLMTFPSDAAGITAAADRVRRLVAYAGIRASLRGGSIRDQALALIASPWNHPGSPYYTRLFTAAGLLANLPTKAQALAAFKESLDHHELHLWDIGDLRELVPLLDDHQAHLLHVYHTTV